MKMCGQGDKADAGTPKVSKVSGQLSQFKDINKGFSIMKVSVREFAAHIFKNHLRKKSVVILYGKCAWALTFESVPKESVPTDL
jgi:hypothetical protein